MSILTEELQKEVFVGGERYEINTDFRVWLEVDRILRSGMDKSSAAEIFKICYRTKLPPTAEEALGAVMSFFAPKKEKADGAPTGRRLFDFEADAGAIYAAFMSEYGMDLTSCRLHWHLFLELLFALGDECKFMKVAAWRGADLSKIKDKERRSFVKKMKCAYALPDNRSPEQRDNDFAAMLWG